MARITNKLIPTGLRSLMSAPEGGERGPQQGPGGPGGPLTPQQRGRRQVFPWLVFAGLLTLLIIAFSSPLGGQKEMVWLDFMNLVKAKSIDPESVVVDGTQLTAKVKPNVEGWSTSKPQAIVVNILPDQQYVVRDLEAAGIPWKATKPSYWPMILINILPVILIIGVIWFIARSMRGAGGGPGGMLGSFGKSRHRLQTKDQVKVTFNDVAGVDEAKDEVQEIVEFLKHPEKFSKLGGRIPRGVLLSGPPG
ncbi:MAG: hypothetical protein ACO3IB_12835, partial [Phycisphaerales bacterium]